MNKIKSKNQYNRSSFIFKCDDDIMKEIRAIANKHRFSIAHFFRESALKNIATYKELQK